MDEKTLYEQLGGAEGVRALVDRFYELIDQLPEAKGIRDLHPADLTGSADKLYKFLSGFLGGTLVNDALLPGKRLWMFSTGTGFAPFASLIRDPETYEKFEEVIVTHTCREVAELAYSQELVASLKDDPLCGEFAGGLHLYATVTREDFPFKGRITDLMASGKVFDDLGVPPIHPETDRGMICGSMAMLKDTKAALEAFGLVEGSNSKPDTFVVERAFVG